MQAIYGMSIVKKKFLKKTLRRRSAEPPAELVYRPKFYK